MKIGDMVTLNTDSFKGPAIVWSSPYRNADFLCHFSLQSFAIVLDSSPGIKWHNTVPRETSQIKILFEHGQGWINQKFLKVVT